MESILSDLLMWMSAAGEYWNILLIIELYGLVHCWDSEGWGWVYIQYWEMTHYFMVLLSYTFVLYFIARFNKNIMWLCYVFRLIFPNGLSDEYSIVTIFRVRRTTKKDRWYLWQIFDQSGSSQVGLTVCVHVSISMY